MNSPSWDWMIIWRFGEQFSGYIVFLKKHFLHSPPPPNLCLSPCCQKCKHTESDKLSVQIQAYLDNVFDVGGLLEDAETKNAALEKVEELEEHLSHVSAPPSLDHQHCF